MIFNLQGSRNPVVKKFRIWDNIVYLRNSWKVLRIFFSDLVSEYLQYQEATAEDDDDDEEVDRYDNDLEQEDAD